MIYYIYSILFNNILYIYIEICLIFLQEKSCSPSHSVENGDSGHVDAANAPSVTGQLVPSSQPTEIVGINTTPVVCLDDVQGRLVKRLSKAGRPIGRPRLSSLAFRGRRRRRFNRVKRKVTITKVPNEILCPPAAEKMAKVIYCCLFTLQFDHHTVCSHCCLLTLQFDHHTVCSPCCLFTLLFDHLAIQSPYCLFTMLFVHHAI